MIKFKGSDCNFLSKQDRQNKAIDIWLQHKGVGTFLHCPRFGKLYEGVNIISRVLNKNPKSNILVIVPSEIIFLQWQTRLNDVGIYTSKQSSDSLLTLATIYSLNNLISSIPIQIGFYNLIVIDEIHRLINTDYLKTLNVLGKFRLGLLGVKPNEQSNQKIEEFAPIIDIITEKEAIENRWIADYIEYNLELELSNDDKVKYTNYTNHMRDTIKQFSNLHKHYTVNNKLMFESEFDLILACYTGKHWNKKYIPSPMLRESVAKLSGWHIDLDMSNPKNVEIDNNWNPADLYNKCKTFKEIVDKRNEILINNDIKLDKVVEILKLNPVPTIIFNESIDFVDKLNLVLNNKGIKSIAYHSKIKSQPLIDPQTNEYYKYGSGSKKGETKIFGKTNIKRYAIEGMKSGYFNVLITVKALDEGLTIENIEQVITTAGSTNPIQYSQRIARGNTFNPNNNKITKVFNLYFNDFCLPDNSLVKSRDKIKLEDRQKYSKDIIYIKNLQEVFGY